MKKLVLLSLLLVPVFVLALTACGEFTETDTDMEVHDHSGHDCSEHETEQLIEIMGEIYAIPAYVDKYPIIYYQDGITIRCLWFDPVGGYWGPEIMFYIENNSDIEYLVQTRYFHMNGMHVTPQLSLKYDSGESGLMPLYFLHRNLHSTGIDIIENVEFRFFFMEYSSPSNTFESDMIYLDLT